MYLGSYSKHEFQAETRKLLDIVARSLYTEKEVYLLYYLFFYIKNFNIAKKKNL
jgi:hypothetical protein